MDLNQFTRQFTRDGKFLMLALDHRDGIKKLINPNDPESVGDEIIIQLKAEIIQALQNQLSGLLIDETYGLEAYPQHNKPFLLPVEKSGYIEDGGQRITELEYSVDQLRQFGASGAKILLYFNPRLPSSERQLATAKQVLRQCQAADFPLFLEIVTYDGGPELVAESVKMFLDNGVAPGVFKLEYPGSVAECQKITGLLNGRPWILLTRGDPYDIFVNELRDAVPAGCQGFLAGRALWQEVCHLQGEQKNQFLTTTLPDRFRQIANIALSS